MNEYSRRLHILNAHQIQMRDHPCISLVFMRIKNSKYYTSMFLENKILAGNRDVNSRRKKCVHQETLSKDSRDVTERSLRMNRLENHTSFFDITG